jgi:ribosomal protein S18 acetylase RimI-like enzyme
VGKLIVIRPVTPGDEDALVAYFAALGPESLRLRFRTGGRPSRYQVRALAGQERSGWLALDGTAIVGEAGYAFRAGMAGDPEIHISVADPWRRRGVATELLTELTRGAISAGVTTCVATVAGDNAVVRGWVERLGGEIVARNWPDATYAVGMQDLSRRLARS